MKIDWRKLWVDYDKWRTETYKPEGYGPTPPAQRAKIQELVEKQLIQTVSSTD